MQKKKKQWREKEFKLFLPSFPSSLDKDFTNFGAELLCNRGTSTGHNNNSSNSSCTNGQFFDSMPSVSHVWTSAQPPKVIN